MGLLPWAVLALLAGFTVLYRRNQPGPKHEFIVGLLEKLEEKGRGDETERD